MIDFPFALCLVQRRRTIFGAIRTNLICHKAVNLRDCTVESNDCEAMIRLLCFYVRQCSIKVSGMEGEQTAFMIRFWLVTVSIRP